MTSETRPAPGWQLLRVLWERFSAAREMLEGGHLDVASGEYLAELTMLIPWKSKQRNAETGYATTFLRRMEEAAGEALEKRVRIVTKSGGLNRFVCRHRAIF